MTEYDYSPEAYERYIRTQRRIAQWVDQTEEHRPEFKVDGSPSLLDRIRHRRQSHSMHEPRRRRRSSSPSSSSSSSSSSGSYSKSPKSPGPMPLPMFQPMHLQQPPFNPSPNHSKHSSSRHHSSSSSRHHSSQHIPIYMGMSPLGSPPAQAYPYGMYRMPPGQMISPGPYGNLAKGNHGASNTVASPTYYQPNTSAPQGYYSNGYPFPPSAYRYPQQQQPHSAPPTGFYPNPTPSSSQTTQGQPPQAVFAPQAQYPPTIYPLTQPGYPTLQAPSVPPKPVFYQRVFGGGSGRRSGRRSR